MLGEIDAELVMAQCKTPEDVGSACALAHGVIVRAAPCTAQAIQCMERCRVISRYGVGVDNVDLAAAAAKGIPVLNVPDYCFEEVSDQAMALFLACVRKTARRDRDVRKGIWDANASDPVHRIAGNTFGIIGYGNIPRVLHRKLKGFNLGRILIYDPYVPPAIIREQGGEAVDLETLVSESDYISVHAPLTPKTRHLIGEREFGLMKKSAIFINTARGPVVNQDALIHALEHERINSAGLDVYEKEPLEPESPLRRLENVVLADHAGWYSEESQLELQTKAALNIVRVLQGSMPSNIVNKDMIQK